MKLNLRILYLYLFSAVGLIIVIFGSINLVNLGLRTFVFPEVDNYEVYDVPKPVGDETMVINKEEQMARQRRDTVRNHQRQLVDAIATLVVGAPLYLYHWRTIQKDATQNSN
jgi:hypothetical protein